MNQISLTGNQLKTIALVTMTVDHIGMILFPRVVLFRIIGRLAFPIFAFMIAEGCRHTRNLDRYLATVAAFAALYQTATLVLGGSLYQCVLVTFTISIGLIRLLKEDRLPPALHTLAVILGFLGALFLTEGLPLLLPGTNYAVDYGMAGVLLPVLVWMGRNRKETMLLFVLGSVLLCMSCGSIQWWCLGSVPLVMLYNGRRGTAKLKYLFYVYYPLHLVVLYLIGLIL